MEGITISRKILVVDDEPDTVDLAKLVLEYEGYEVVVAYDGKEALAKTYEERPDLILLDIILPKLDGIEVCRALNADPRYKDIPIVLFTAKVLYTDKEEGFKAGADEYITKPFSERALLELIRKYLE